MDRIPDQDRQWWEAEQPPGGFRAGRPPKKSRVKRGIVAAAALYLLCAVGYGGIWENLPAGPDGSRDGPPQQTEGPRLSIPERVDQTGEVPVKTLMPTEIYTLASVSCVGISTQVTNTNVFGQTSTGSVTGSGFVLTRDGYIATNYHVIESAVKTGADIQVMLYNGERHTARAVGYEAENDLALLKIEANDLPYVALGDSEAMQVGEPIYTIGNPLGELTYTMTSGIISALDREITTDQTTVINMFQIDAAVNSGNSGGPVFNDRGQVIGIVSAKYASTGVEGLGFAIPIQDAVIILQDLMDHGYVMGKAWLGISVVTVTEAAAQSYSMVQGACIYSMEENGCACKAGLKVGDVITQIDDHKILSAADLIAARKLYQAGDTVTINASRNGGSRTFTMILDERRPDENPAGTNQPSPSLSPSPSPSPSPLPGA